ncbi:carbonic anhydrase [Mycena vulgaris]|nr:carbonic anhydrase [Mycena vulgaris]
MITGALFFAVLSASPLKAESRSASLDRVSATSSASASSTSTTIPGAASPSSAPIGIIDDAALSALLDGNKKFKASSKLSIAQNLTKNGPEPPFMIFECADNRFTAGTILHGTLGTIFGHHNLGNLYSHTDANADAALVYGVEALGVKHIIVMGHYGCPTVGAALVSNATTTLGHKSRAEPNHNHTSKEVEAWIQPIHEVYLSSNRQLPILSEIIALRNNKTAFPTGIPDASHLGFRALVEENVKASVARIREDSILAKVKTSFFHLIFLIFRKQTGSAINPAPTGDPTEIDVFVHGFVYDMDTGDVYNLGVTFGPPGKTLPKVPFSAVASATKALEGAHSTSASAAPSASKKSLESASASAS